MADHGPTSGPAIDLFHHDVEPSGRRNETMMSGAVSEYEFEALPELGAGYESELEGDRESEQFFGALANLARQGVGWLTAPGSTQRQAALTLARQAIGQGLPALGRWGGPTASWLGGLLPQQEYEWESEFEISPIRKIYPDAMMEHLGHAAAEAQGEAEAESLAGAIIPLAARVIPQAAPTLARAMPALVSGVSGVVRRLHRDPATRPLVRVVPTIVRRTAADIAQTTSRGVAVTPQQALRILARQILRVLGSPQTSAQAFRRSRTLDRKFHRNGGVSQQGRTYPTCASCRAKVR
jgi:hypothetical protein